MWENGQLRQGIWLQRGTSDMEIKVKSGHGEIYRHKCNADCTFVLSVGIVVNEYDAVHDAPREDVRLPWMCKMDDSVDMRRCFCWFAAAYSRPVTPEEADVL